MINGRHQEKRKLFDLCDNADQGEEPLKELRQWLIRHQQDKKYFQAAAMYRDHERNRSTLHLVLEKKLPVDILETILSHAPMAATVKSANGVTLLHWAMVGGVSLDIVQALVKAYPESSRMLDQLGCSPLHWACYSGASLEVLNFLLEQYPKSIDLEDTFQNKEPYVFLKSWAQSEAGREDHALLLHNAIDRGFSILLIQLLTQAFPESCLLKDSCGRIPLHHACANKNNMVDVVEIVMILLNANPESLMVTDQQNRIAAQLFQPVASTKGENGMFPLHYQASRGTLTVHSLMLFFMAYPEAISLEDGYGMLPFHHVCLNTSSSIDLLMSFLKLYPEIIAVEYPLAETATRDITPA